MKAAWYEKQGAARDVLTVGEMDEPQPLAGEARIRVAASGVNPGDVKKRQDSFGVGMPYPRVIPHSDGAGTVDAVGKEYHRNGSDGVCGVMELSLTVPLGPPLNTPWFLCSRRSRCPKPCRWKRAPVSVFPA